MFFIVGDKRLMNVLFLHQKLFPVGGIETLIVRLIEASNEKNVSIDLLLYQQDEGSCELVKKVSPYVKMLKIYSGMFRSLSLWTPTVESDYDVIFCFGWRSLLLGLLLKKYSFPKAKLCLGVYHPREFCWDTTLGSYGQRLISRVLEKTPKENIIFMNELCKNEHEKILGIDFSGSSIIPLAVNVSDVLRDAVSLRIVSVGRLVDFKMYNFFMLDVIKSLRNNTGLDFEYHVYGDGECLEDLLLKVERLGLSQCVFFHGSIPYSQLPNIFKEAWLFVGMGSSLIEAAAYGVPSIIVVESEERPLTYGFIHETEGLNSGEFNSNLELYSIEDKIMLLVSLDENEYENLEIYSRESVEMCKIDNVFEKMMNVFLNASQDSYHLTNKERFLDSLTGVFWTIVARYGLNSPLKNRYLKKL